MNRLPEGERPNTHRSFRGDAAGTTPLDVSGIVASKGPTPGDRGPVSPDDRGFLPSNQWRFRGDIDQPPPTRGPLIKSTGRSKSAPLIEKIPVGPEIEAHRARVDKIASRFVDPETTELSETDRAKLSDTAGAIEGIERNWPGLDPEELRTRKERIATIENDLLEQKVTGGDGPLKITLVDRARLYLSAAGQELAEQYQTAYTKED